MTKRTPVSWQFSLRRLLIGVAIVSVAVVGLLKAYEAFRGNYERIARQIQTVEGIHDIHVLGDYEAGTRNVEVLTFRIKGKPNSVVTIWSPDCDIFIDADHIGLEQIGDVHLYSGIEDSATGYSAGGCIDIGRKSRLASVLPFTIRNVHELIERYDELDTFFRSWPKYPEVGRIKASSSRTIEYQTWMRNE